MPAASRAGVPSVVSPSTGAAGASSTRLPSASTTCAAASRPRTAPCRANRLPDVLRPIIPPTVVTAALLGSGPNVRPSRARCSSSCSATTPGWTRTCVADVWMIRRMNRAVSITMPLPSASPAIPVPAPRGWIAMPRSAAQPTVAATSSADRGRTTTSGQHSNRLASVA